MYKTKLQELCHKRRWGLPRYCAMKDGPDHMPSFKASVFVNGVTFTSAAFRSSKEAQNQAAMHAFLTFSAGSSTPTADYDKKEKIIAAEPQHFPFPVRPSAIIDVKDCLWKNQLQNYALKNNLDQPVFTCKIDGPPHAPRFKATVLVNGKSFESPSFFNRIKEAQQAAAKVALMSLSVDLFEKNDSGPFKILLLKLTEREGLCKPTYKTIQSGSPHMPTFFTTVEVKGMEFHGKGGRSKKQAEHDAAKIAYIALKECGVNMCAAFAPSHIENKDVKSKHSADLTEDTQNIKLEGSSCI